MTIPYRYVNKLVVFRKFPIVTGNIYHIFNRGVNKGDIFFEEEDYKRFIKVATHYLANKWTFSHSVIGNIIHSDPVSELAAVEVLGYCLMPNHFHFIVKQVADRGITWYMQHVSNSYSHYIHTKYKRVGPLFEGRFKNVLVETDEQLLHLSRYIHLNPVVSGLAASLEDYPWSSYKVYLGFNDYLCQTKTILGYFKTSEEYKRFILDQVDYGRELEKIKHMTIDSEA